MRKLLILGFVLSLGTMVCRAQNEEKIPLQGGIRWTQDVSNLEFIWDWLSWEPTWEFTEEAYNSELKMYNDYGVYWTDNKYPGTATLEVRGEGRYTGSLFATFEVKKASEVPHSSDAYYSYWRNRGRVYYCDGFETEAPWYVSSMSYADKRSMPIVQYRPYKTKDALTTTLPREDGKYEVWITWPESEVSKEFGPDSIGAFTVYDYNAQWNALKAMKEPLLALVPEGMDGRPMSNWTFEEGPWKIDGYTWSLTLAENGAIERINLPNCYLKGDLPKEAFLMPGIKGLYLHSWGSNDNKNILTGRLDDIVAEAAAEGMPALQSLEILNIAENQFTGNLGRAVSFFSNLKELYANDNCFAEVHPMINPDIYLNYNYQHLDSIIHINASHPDTEAIYAECPEICKYVHKNQEYSVVYGCNFEPCNAEWGFEIPNDPIIKLWERASFGHHWPYELYNFTSDGSWRNAVYYGENGQMFPCRSYANDGGYGNNQNYMKMVITYDDYDVNMTDGFNVADVQCVINYMSDMYFPRFILNFNEADVVKDGKINVQDIALIITKLLEKEEAESPQQIRSKVGGEEMFFIDATGRVCLSTDEPVSAFELTLRGTTIPAKISALDQAGMSYRVLNNGNYSRIVVYTFDKEKTIAPGILPLFDAFDASSIRGLATDFDGKYLSLPFSGSTDGVESIVAPADGKIVNVSGRTLQFANMALDNLSWRVISTQGREVARGNAENGCCASADLSGIPAGIYVVEISADGMATRTAKVIIK